MINDRGLKAHYDNCNLWTEGATGEERKSRERGEGRVGRECDCLALAEVKWSYNRLD